MKISGRDLADLIAYDLRKRIGKLQESNITPKLAIILVGEDPSSLSYIRQKQKFADRINAQLELHQYPITVDQDTVRNEIQKLNKDSSVHGIIVQLPLPSSFDEKEFVSLVTREKDIDGFLSDSPFEVPVARGVIKLLQVIHVQLGRNIPFLPWPEEFKVVVLGKGKTAGEPIGALLKKLSIPYTQIDSKTQNQSELIKNADVVISCVGKTIITKEMIKENAILIGVGIHTENNHLKGDYEEADIEDKASFYTSTPGGVGPMNVACLLENLVIAAETTNS